METLFIGGPKDGQRIFVPCTLQEMRIPAEYDVDTHLGPPPEPHIYDIVTFLDLNSSRYRVACHRGLREPLGALIVGYKRK
jgi:hypothetical protein